LSRGQPALIAAGGVVAIIVVLGAALLLLRGDSDKNDATGTVLLEPVSSASNAFSDPVGTDDAKMPDNPNGVSTEVGSTPGLYGGTMNSASCNKRQLVDYLKENPDKSAAWASVLNMQPSEIPAFVETLTPVLLRSDTRVTNHGYVEGRATTIPSVLEAGTAVLVSDKGEPVTKCYCGNPLTAAATGPDLFAGTPWPGFSADKLTTIAPSAKSITSFVLYDPATNTTFIRPAGSDGTRDTRSVATSTTSSLAPTSAPTVSPPTTGRVTTTTRSNLVTIPVVIGMTQAAASGAIESLGFDTAVLSECSDFVAAGLVIRQDPSGGTQADRNVSAVVTLTISRGPCPPKTVSTATTTPTTEP
jgi:hypothetical protein